MITDRSLNRYDDWIVKWIDVWRVRSAVFFFCFHCILLHSFMFFQVHSIPETRTLCSIRNLRPNRDAFQNRSFHQTKSVTAGRPTWLKCLEYSIPVLNVVFSSKSQKEINFHTWFFGDLFLFWLNFRELCGTFVFCQQNLSKNFSSKRNRANQNKFPQWKNDAENRLSGPLGDF